MQRQVLRIVSRRDGFRRAGLRHPAKPTDHDFGDFTAKQLDALDAEPLLTVKYLELPDDEQAAAEQAAAEKAAADKVATDKAAADKAAAEKAAAEKKPGKRA